MYLNTNKYYPAALLALTIFSCGKKDQQQQKPQPDKLSKEDAERMLDALNNDEKQTQDKLKDKKLKGARVRVTKDW